MKSAPIICFGQQPCGFFPKRFLVAKIQTARRLQKEVGGEIVFFCHDSDHDPRETQTLLRHRKTREPARLNFAFVNRVQRKFSPQYLKKIAAGWQDKTVLQLPNYVGHPLINLFQKVSAANVADFCLEMYRGLGLLEGVRVVRSSDPAVRRAACDVEEFFVDVPYEGEIVRARFNAGAPVSDPARIGHPTQKSAEPVLGVPTLSLHEGGNSYVTVPAAAFGRDQVSPTRDTRLRWMQSVVHCTHYIAGPGERAYLHPEETPEITFINRDAIERADEADTEIPI
ncbi:MAG TPA: hypothetical protein VMA35_16005 [Candidatus Sulfopaludibacter sp.]|nr:hypothetical protein [Candidatus Sulfopaludibacter sp.]